MKLFGAGEMSPQVEYFYEDNESADSGVIEGEDPNDIAVSRLLEAAQIQAKNVREGERVEVEVPLSEEVDIITVETIITERANEYRLMRTEHLPKVIEGMGGVALVWAQFQALSR